jgi:PAS domain S-box-containing protein
VAAASVTSVSTPDPKAADLDTRLVKLLVDTVRDHAIFALDPDGLISTWNGGGARLFGYEAQEIVGRPWATLYSPEDLERGRPDRDMAIAVADGHFHDETWRARADGELFWTDTDLMALRGHDGRLSGFGVVSSDLSERRRGEELLRESEERFRLLVNSVGDYAIFLLDEQGHVSSWNLGAERLKGYRSDEILGRHFSAFYPQDEVKARVPPQLLQRALRDGRVENEGWRVRKDGSRFWASVVITALRGPDGSNRGFAKVTKDLTDRKRNEDALRGVLERERDAANRLRETDRMRADVVGVVAHDLRAPLNVVQNLVHLAQADWATLDDGERLDYLKRIGDRLTGMSELVDDLFDVVRIEAGQLETERRRFDIGEVAARAIADAVSEGELARVSLDSQAQAIAVGDPHRTWQVVVNLISNALKFSEPGTPIEVGVVARDHAITVSVIDHGPGIPDHQRHLLFQRFSRLDTGNDTSGIGIGLFVARSMIQSQGGTIGVESTPGGGSTFWFSLPAPP